MVLDGGDHYEADREVGLRLQAVAPHFLGAMQINAVYNDRTVRMLAKEGIRGFLDLGAGLPLIPPSTKFPDTFVSATGAGAGAHVVHVDNDPAVEGHLRMCSTGDRGEHDSVLADLRDIDALIDHPRVQSLMDRGGVCVLIHDVLPYVVSDADAALITQVLRARLPPGSVISLTHATSDLCPQEMTAVAKVLEAAGLPYRPRTRQQIHDLLAPWPLRDPGLVPTGRFHPGHLHAQLPDSRSCAFAALAVRP
ncbi:hypothetical protein G3I29_33075 [Streptomyces halstedii]|uniref:SAM-dependent methyltransferase n=2 Tax=Streptomyces halstedii TaxID=1944 RepID=A0A6N9UC50_STRHA|nr:hypothetical protein [Streptomyces halstedii]